MADRIKVVSLDLDGVLYDGPSAVHPLTKALGIEQDFLRVFKKLGDGKRSLSDAIKEGARIWIGVPSDGTLDPLVENLPLMKGAEEVVAALKEGGLKVGCVSSGVSQFFMKPFKKRLKLDFAFSNVLGETDGKHDGSVHYVMAGPQKAEKVLEYIENDGYSKLELASVGDGENDIDLFKVSALSIAYNPVSDEVSKAADLTIRSKDLRTILPHFMLQD
ncbi:MAG: HAD-IB family phosphatase [Candidatus Hermodarchaeota archaeon]